MPSKMADLSALAFQRISMARQRMLGSSFLHLSSHCSGEEGRLIPNLFVLMWGKNGKCGLSNLWRVTLQRRLFWHPHTQSDHGWRASPSTEPCPFFWCQPSWKPWVCSSWQRALEPFWHPLNLWIHPQQLGLAIFELKAVTPG